MRVNIALTLNQQDYSLILAIRFAIEEREKLSFNDLRFCRKPLEDNAASRM